MHKNLKYIFLLSLISFTSTSLIGLEVLLNLGICRKPQVRVTMPESGFRELLIKNLNTSSTVLDIKKEIEKKKGIPIDRQRIIVGGKELDDSSPYYGEFDYRKLKFIQLILRPDKPKIVLYPTIAPSLPPIKPKIENQMAMTNKRNIAPGSDSDPAPPINKDTSPSSINNGFSKKEKAAYISLLVGAIGLTRSILSYLKQKKMRTFQGNKKTLPDESKTTYAHAAKKSLRRTIAST